MTLRPGDMFCVNPLVRRTRLMELPWDSSTDMNAKAITTVHGGEMGIVVATCASEPHESFVMLGTRVGWLYNADLQMLAKAADA